MVYQLSNDFIFPKLTFVLFIPTLRVSRSYFCGESRVWLLFPALVSGAFCGHVTESHRWQSRAQAQTKQTVVSAANEGHSDESPCTAPVRAHWKITTYVGVVTGTVEILVVNSRLDKVRCTWCWTSVPHVFKMLYIFLMHNYTTTFRFHWPLLFMCLKTTVWCVDVRMPNQTVIIKSCLRELGKWKRRNHPL